MKTFLRIQTKSYSSAIDTENQPFFHTPFTLQYQKTYHTYKSISLFKKEIDMRRLNLLSLIIVITTITTQHNYSSTIELQNTARTTDLIIINDVLDTERYIYPLWMTSSAPSVMKEELLETLMSNNIVLCPKALWISIQHEIQSWYLIAQHQGSIDQLLEKFTQLPENIHNQKTKNKILASATKQNITTLKIKQIRTNILLSVYNRLNKEITNASPLQQSKIIERSIILYIQELRNKLVKSLTYTQAMTMPLMDDYDDRYHLNQVMNYNIVLSNQYTCKEVNDTFLLFVPKRLQRFKNHINQQQFLGINYLSLPDYDYELFAHDQDIESIFHIIPTMIKENTLGKKLLQTLQSIIIHPNTMKNSIAPWFNIYLTGHGSHDLIAEIPCTPQNTTVSNPKSDFLDLLSFFKHNLLTKSLTLSTCFIGGDKLTQTYDIKNPFNNLTLESLSYPIINIGSFYATTLLTSKTSLPAFKNLKVFNHRMVGPSDENEYTKYFNFLNQSPPNYTKAATVFAPIITEFAPIIPGTYGAIDYDTTYQQNYCSIKFPHTSWFTPIDMPRYSKSITQTNVLTHDKNQKLVIPENIKIILLTATHIPFTIKTNTTKYIPAFFPMNYMNQNYIIDHLEAPATTAYDNSQVGNKNLEIVFQSLLPMPTIEEPINVIIKKLTVGNDTYTNIWAFTHQIIPNNVSSESFIIATGYFYTDKQGVTHRVLIRDDTYFPEIITESSYKEQILDKMYEIEEDAKSGVKKTESFEKISELFEHEPLEKTKEIIRESHKQYTEQQLQELIEQETKQRSEIQTLEHDLLQKSRLVQKFMNQQKITRLVDMVKLLHS